MSLFFLVAGCAVADTTFYTRSNVNPITQPVEQDGFPSVGREAAQSIECDCLTTNINGDPYNGVTVTTTYNYHQVNPQAVFYIGILLPGTYRFLRDRNSTREKHTVCRRSE